MDEKAGAAMMHFKRTALPSLAARVRQGTVQPKSGMDFLLVGASDGVAPSEAIFSPQDIENIRRQAQALTGRIGRR